jgi:hypothetical protein
MFGKERFDNGKVRESVVFTDEAVALICIFQQRHRAVALLQCSREFPNAIDLDANIVNAMRKEDRMVEIIA